MANATFEIDDNKALDGNLTALVERLKEIDADLGPVLGARLKEMADGKVDKDEVWDALFAAAEEKKP